MTRLTEADIGSIQAELEAYDAGLKGKTGASLRQIACCAAEVEEAWILGVLKRVRFAAVPVTSGLGLIRGFSEAVATIVSHLGFEAFVTENHDRAGIVEGQERGAEAFLLAGDRRFVALTPGTRQTVDNTPATARGFVAGLELMKGGLTGESVLVLGCGPLGIEGGRELLRRGASVALSDIEVERARAAKLELGEKPPGVVRVEEDLEAALRRYEVIFEATDAEGFITSTHLTPDTFLAAPGMPLAVAPEAMADHGEHILHDALEIGTATMAVEVAAALVGGAEAGKAAQG